jgi:CRISPR/Cas system-associated exonuclease Cas4 (RecB family)
MKLPEPPNIYMVRGNIVHSALEFFFEIDPSAISEPAKELPKRAEKLLDTYWIENIKKLKELELTSEKLNEFYVDSREMLNRWMQKFLKQIDDTGKDFTEAWKELKPSAEEYLKSEKLGVQGYIDALFNYEDGTIKLVDYKTSRKDIVTPEYRLQAGIYAVLVQEIKGVLPSKIEFDFLKGQTQPVEVTEMLVNDTKFEIEQIHMATEGKKPEDYPKKPSGLCKWSNERGSGQCAFYEICKPRG